MCLYVVRTWFVYYTIIDSNEVDLRIYIPEKVIITTS